VTVGIREGLMDARLPRIGLCIAVEAPNEAAVDPAVILVIGSDVAKSRGDQPERLSWGHVDRRRECEVNAAVTAHRHRHRHRTEFAAEGVGPSGEDSDRRLVVAAVFVGAEQAVAPGRQLAGSWLLRPRLAL
jgi:hypothetical protein